MGHFKSLNFCLYHVLFFKYVLCLISRFFQMPSLERSKKVKCEDCDKENSRSYAALNSKSCALQFFSINAMLILYLQPARNQFQYGQKAHKVNPKVKKSVHCVRTDFQEDPIKKKVRANIYFINKKNLQFLLFSCKVTRGNSNSFR